MRTDDETTFLLGAEQIDVYSERLSGILSKMGVERRNLIHIRITIEEALLRLRDHFGEDTEVTAAVGSNLMGPFILLTHEGGPFNPLGVGDADDEGYSAPLPTMAGLRPQYSFAANRNTLRLSFPRPGKNPALVMLAALAVGTIVGLVGQPVLSLIAPGAAIDAVIDPLFDFWVRTLNVLAAPVIFFMVVTTMLDMRMVDERGGNRHSMLVRYFGVSILVGLVAVAVAGLAYRPPLTHETYGAGFIVALLEGASQFIPEHIVEPFSTSNTPQLLLIAFVVANAIIALGEQVRTLAKVVQQLNMTNSLVTKWVSSLAPLFAGLLLALEIINGQVNVLVQIWRPLVLSLVISVAFMALEIAVLSWRFKVSPKALVRKIWAPFAVAVRAGTLDDAYGEAEFSCVRGLGINQAFTDVTLPLGLVLYMPASIMGTLVFTVFSAGVLGTSTTLSWYVMAVVLDVLLFVATPPVPGANLLAFIALFQQLGIPQEAFLDAMIFDIVFGLFANAANQSLLQLELTTLSNGLGMLDLKTLRS